MEKLLYLIVLVTVLQCNGYQPTHRDFSPTPDRTIQTAIGLGQSILGSISQGLGFNYGQQNPNGQSTHVEEQSNYNENHWQKPPFGHGNHQGQHFNKPSYPERPNGNYGPPFGNHEQQGQGPPNNYHHHHNHHHHHHTHGHHHEHPHHHHQGNYNNNGDFNTNSEHPNIQHQGHHNHGHNSNSRPTNQHYGIHNKPGHENSHQFNQNNQPNHENHPSNHQQHLTTGQHNSGFHNPNNKPSNEFPTKPSPSPFADKTTEDPMKGIPAFLALIPKEPNNTTENEKPETDAEDFEIDIRFKDQ